MRPGLGQIHPSSHLLSVNDNLTDLNHSTAQESRYCKINKDELHNITGQEIRWVGQIIIGKEVMEGHSSIRTQEWSLAVQLQVGKNNAEQRPCQVPGGV